MRPLATELPGSLIRTIANAALGRSDVIPLWFGESDLVTPAFIRAAAKRALDHHGLDRVAVLERIVTDKGYGLSEEIEACRAAGAALEAKE